MTPPSDIIHIGLKGFAVLKTLNRSKTYIWWRQRTFPCWYPVRQTPVNRLRKSGIEVVQGLVPGEHLIKLEVTLMSHQAQLLSGNVHKENCSANAEVYLKYRNYKASLIGDHGLLCRKLLQSQDRQHQLVLVFQVRREACYRYTASAK